jgi:diguanylate cyclase (GGDEF)-like protein/PAS domain S-box-containing protein
VGAFVDAPDVAQWVSGRMMCDVDDKIVLVDPELAAALGYLPDALIGRSALDLVAASRRMALVTAAASLRDGREPTAVVRSAFEAADGRVIPAQVVLSLHSGVNGSARHGLVCTVLIDDAQPVGAVPPAPQPMPSWTPSRHARQDAPAGPSVRHPHATTADAPAAPVELTQLMQSVEATAQAVQHLLQVTHTAMAAAATCYAAQSTPVPPGPDAAPAPAIDRPTGLATRSVLLAEMRAAGADGVDFAVLLVDLDEFKAINDTHGHDIGDEVLVHVADRLRACVRPDDVVVRFGGDEFVILCRAAQAAITVAGRVVALLAPPIETAAGPIPITASVGISDASIPIDTVTDLLTRADAAMYWAKEQGKNRYFEYDAVLHERTVRENHTRRLLSSAVADGRIEVHYQPILTIDGVDVIGVEAVARLVGDDGTTLLPADFLSVAERTGLIATIDAAVLTESCRCVGNLMRGIGRPLAVSVNVSQRFIARPDLVEFVMSALAEAHLPAAALMLELTESALIGAGSSAIARLAELRARGVQVALDNFGAGFSPLSFLRNLPLSYVKVDRPCIVGMMTDDRDAAMIQAVTWLVERLGLAWIAEGVETVDEWEAVRRFGPGLAQGYLFAEPLAEAALLRRLRAGLTGGPGRRASNLVSA